MTKTVIYRTAKSYELEMVLAAFEEAEIPCYSQAYSSTGIRFADDHSRSMGPGSFYELVIDAVDTEKAKSLIDSLPFIGSEEPGFWDFAPKMNSKFLFKILSLAILIVSVIALLKSILDGL